MKGQQSGFTLVELVAVIVVLGILSATAIPKFVGFSKDARIGVLDSVASSMRSAGAMVHAKSIIDGLESKRSAYVPIDGVVGTGAGADADSVRTRFGYPHRSEITNLIELENDNNQFTLGTGRVELIANCRVDYAHATSADQAPTISLTTTGC